MALRPRSPTGRGVGRAGDEPDGRQSGQIFKTLGLIEQPQPSAGQGLIETGKAALSLLAKRWVDRLAQDRITPEA